MRGLRALLVLAVALALQVALSSLWTGSARFVDYAPGRATIRAELVRAGRVVFSETALPGWSVTVDGRPAVVERFAPRTQPEKIAPRIESLLPG